jgi:deoxyribodipyrimidine photo-lyase
LENIKANLMQEEINVFWFRRDLRLNDNIGLIEAMKSGKPILPIFIFDQNILKDINKNDARVSFIYNTLCKIDQILKQKFSSGIAMYHGDPLTVFENLIKMYSVSSVFTNHDYEPYAINRDQQINELLLNKNITFNTYKDQVIFEKNEIVKADGKPYLVYTPYMKKWKATFKKKLTHQKSIYNFNFLKSNCLPKLDLNAIGFVPSNIRIEPLNLNTDLIQNYVLYRDYPAKKATSNLSPHLRFGTVSIREVVKQAKNETFLNELIWREFFMQILWHFPQTITQSFKPQYDQIEWRNNEEEFKLWCEGKTGYPLVDAGMRQLNETGYLHNRVRMVVGSFLCKHLLIDWRWGEAYFAEKLNDYELSSNVGNWQWVAGTGVDAAPYFRIFNPTTQIQKFDKNLEYVSTWVNDFQDFNYPKPIVEHKFARERCLNAYKKALQMV